MDRDKILQRFEHETERLTAGVLLDKIVQVERTGALQLTDFFDPYQQRTADRVLHHFKEIKQVMWGGYDGAERVRLLLFPAEKQASVSDVPLAYIEATLPALATELTHRDFLGAILGLGLRREKVGDILFVTKEKTQIIVQPEILSFLLTQWQEVGRYGIRLHEITETELSPAQGRIREVKTTVASLRLDAVASSGFGLSRSKLTPAIRAGHVKLNWQSVKSASATVKEGDIISVTGRGRVEVAHVLGESKKGRIQLLLKKHI
ncbi:MAG: YlmH/Sll1252 family protein [Firmicutes bacterium]|nr:YlmH/Sll1252 family protein [Bacillota bacterium]